MAAITSIRKRSGIIVFIIGAALVMFLAGDALSSQFNILGGSPNKIAKVRGKTVTYQDYEKRYQREIDVIRLRNTFMNRNTDMNEEVYQQVRDFSWNNIIKELILNKEISNLGISLTNEELTQLVQGFEPHPFIKQFPFFLSTKTGAFDANLIPEFLEYLKTDETGEPTRLWNYYKDYVHQDQLEGKYYSAFKKGIYVSNWQAKEDYNEKNKKADINFVFVNYNTIADDDITVEEADISAYVKKQNGKYAKEENTRQVSYVAFRIIPSREDTIGSFEWVEALNEAFADAENDSIFLSRNSEFAYNASYFTKEKLGSQAADSIFNVDSAAVIGPFFENGSFMSVKLLNKKLIPDSVNVRHILLAVNSAEEYLKNLALADSLRDSLKRGEGDFVDFAARYSNDQANASDSGNLGWVQPEAMVKPFNDAIFFKGKQGDILKVQTNFGIHIVEILQATPSIEAVQVAFLAREVRASSATESTIFSMVNSFAGHNRKRADFIASYNQVPLTSIIVKNKPEPFKVDDFFVTGIGNARPVISWAFNSKEGEVSDIIELEDIFVVILLEKINKSGSVDIEEVRTEVEVAVRTEKKASLVLKNMKTALANVNMNDLEAIAAALNQQVRSASNITFSSPFVPGVGREVKVTGTIFGLQVGVISEPINGENGILIVQVKEFTPAPESLDYLSTRDQLEQAYIIRTQASLIDGLKKYIGFEDTRYKIY